MMKARSVLASPRKVLALLILAAVVSPLGCGSAQSGDTSTSSGAEAEKSSTPAAAPKSNVKGRKSKVDTSSRRERQESKKEGNP